MILMGLPIFVKLIIAVFIDITDFFLGAIPGFNTIFDLVATFIAISLAGVAGVIAATELITPGPLDSFFPTVTMSVLAGHFIMGN